MICIKSIKNHYLDRLGFACFSSHKLFEHYGLQKYDVLQSAGAFRLDLLPPSTFLLFRVSK